MHQHQTGHLGDPVHPGQLPLPVNVDLTTLDTMLLQSCCYLIKLRLELSARSAPVSVELHQTILTTEHHLVEVVPGQLCCQLCCQWLRLRCKSSLYMWYISSWLWFISSYPIRHTQRPTKVMKLTFIFLIMYLQSDEETKLL